MSYCATEYRIWKLKYRSAEMSERLVGVGHSRDRADANNRKRFARGGSSGLKGREAGGEGSRTTPRGRKNVAHRVVKGLSEDIALRSCPRTVYLLPLLRPPLPSPPRSPPSLWEPPMYQRSNVSSASLLLWSFRALYGRNFLRSNVRTQWRKASSATALEIPSADDMRKRSITI